ncbi:MAG: DUF5683 domain-containing protein [bacterium]
MCARTIRQCFLLILLMSSTNNLFAQKELKTTNKKTQAPLATDSSKKSSIKDTTHKVRSNAGKASLRSAILPGLGQVYNKKYWKVPIVYGILAIPVSTFSYNSTWYKKTRFAYAARSDKDTTNDKLIAPELQPLATDALKLYRNEFRKGMDFSILGLLVLWGLNVADAAVDGHLKSFDISDDLSMRLKPNLSTGRNGQMGFTASFHLGKTKPVKSVSF